MPEPQNKQPFLYVACQHGAEPILKTQLCEPLGPFRLAYSNKGLLTLKSQLPVGPWTRALPEHPLVRSRGFVLGKIEGTESAPMIEEILERFGQVDWQVGHVWQRDIAQPGWNGFEPGSSALAWSVAVELQRALRLRGDAREVLANPPDGLEPAERSNLATPGASSRSMNQILEIIIDEPNRWWVATKLAQQPFDYWPGGVPEFPVPDEILSRAYLKIAEAFAWGDLAIRPGEKIVEIGSSPGGACQWLLDQGAVVTGVDPAEMDPRIMTHPNFTHWRSRSLQLKRKLFRPFRILVCDANVTPNYTLDTVESIVQYPTSRMRALVLTIKFPKWESAENLGEYIDRVKSWGYTDIQVRQLAHNRREVCLIAKDRVKRPEPTVDESSAQDTPLARAAEKLQNAEKSPSAEKATAKTPTDTEKQANTEKTAHREKQANSEKSANAAHQANDGE